MDKRFPLAAGAALILGLVFWEFESVGPSNWELDRNIDEPQAEAVQANPERVQLSTADRQQADALPERASDWAKATGESLTLFRFVGQNAEHIIPEHIYAIRLNSELHEWMNDGWEQVVLLPLKVEEGGVFVATFENYLPQIFATRPNVNPQGGFDIPVHPMANFKIEITRSRNSKDATTKVWFEPQLDRIWVSPPSSNYGEPPAFHYFEFELASNTSWKVNKGSYLIKKLPTTVPTRSELQRLAFSIRDFLIDHFNYSLFDKEDAVYTPLFALETRKSTTGQSMVWPHLPAGMSYHWRSSLPMVELDSAESRSKIYTSGNSDPCIIELAQNGWTGIVDFKKAGESKVLSLVETEPASLSFLLPAIDPVPGSASYKVFRIDLHHSEEQPILEASPHNAMKGFNFGHLRPGKYAVLARWQFNGAINLCYRSVDLLPGEAKHIGILQPSSNNPLVLNAGIVDTAGESLVEMQKSLGLVGHSYTIRVWSETGQWPNLGKDWDFEVPIGRHRIINGLPDGTLFAEIADTTLTNLANNSWDEFAADSAQRFALPGTRELSFSTTLADSLPVPTLQLLLPDRFDPATTPWSIYSKKSSERVLGGFLTEHSVIENGRAYFPLRLPPGTYQFYMLPISVEQQPIHPFAFKEFQIDSQITSVEIPVQATCIQHGRRVSSAGEPASAGFDKMQLFEVAGVRLIRPRLFDFLCDGAGNFVIYGMPTSGKFGPGFFSPEYSIAPGHKLEIRSR